MPAAFELSLGFFIIIAAMILHLAATILVVKVVRPLEFLLKASPYVFLSIALIVTNLIFFIAHLAGVGIWASLYLFLDLAPDYSNAFYSAFIMNTTLGLGFVRPEIGTRLLAPLTASSGIIMIGWSTAVFIYVVQAYLPRIAHRR